MNNGWRVSRATVTKITRFGSTNNAGTYNFPRCRHQFMLTLVILFLNEGNSFQLNYSTVVISKHFRDTKDLAASPIFRFEACDLAHWLVQARTRSNSWARNPCFANLTSTPASPLFSRVIKYGLIIPWRYIWWKPSSKSILVTQKHVEREVLGEVCVLFWNQSNTSQLTTPVRHKSNKTSCKYDKFDWRTFQIQRSLTSRTILRWYLTNPASNFCILIVSPCQPWWKFGTI